MGGGVSPLHFRWVWEAGGLLYAGAHVMPLLPIQEAVGCRLMVGSLN